MLECMGAAAHHPSRCSDLATSWTPSTAWSDSSEKAEWALLQSVEASHRGTPIVAPTVVEAWDHEVLGVRGFDGQNIWVLLKPKAPPYYKQVPRGNYELPKEFVDQLVKGRRLSYTVEHVLVSRATE